MVVISRESEEERKAEKDFEVRMTWTGIVSRVIDELRTFFDVNKKFAFKVNLVEPNQEVYRTEFFKDYSLPLLGNVVHQKDETWRVINFFGFPTMEVLYHEIIHAMQMEINPYLQSYLKDEQINNEHWISLREMLRSQEGQTLEDTVRLNIPHLLKTVNDRLLIQMGMEVVAESYSKYLKAKKREETGLVEKPQAISSKFEVDTSKPDHAEEWSRKLRELADWEDKKNILESDSETEVDALLAILRGDDEQLFEDALVMMGIRRFKQFKYHHWVSDFVYDYRADPSQVFLKYEVDGSIVTTTAFYTLDYASSEDLRGDFVAKFRQEPLKLGRELLEYVPLREQLFNKITPYTFHKLMRSPKKMLFFTESMIREMNCNQ